MLYNYSYTRTIIDSKYSRILSLHTFTRDYERLRERKLGIEIIDGRKQRAFSPLSYLFDKETNRERIKTGG